MFRKLGEVVSYVETNEWIEAEETVVAKCQDGAATMVGLFFSEQLDDIATAKAICNTCALQESCLDGALARREPWGVWGGQLFFNGKVLAFKRKRGRPRKDEQIPLTA
jgi:WhiB family redox-sensing transcriptional regulator